MSIGDRIRSERKRQNLTLRELSERADISISYLGDIENERSMPSVPRLKDIARALNKSAAYFIDDEEMAEEFDVYLPVEREIKVLLELLLQTEGFREILREFEGFPGWTDREKAEVLSFLKTKREYRR